MNNLRGNQEEKMKKLMIMMVVLTSVAFGKDFDHRERNDLDNVMNYTKVSQEMSSRERNITDQNIEKNSEYHWELMNMDRGHEDR